MLPAVERYCRCLDAPRRAGGAVFVLLVSAFAAAVGGQGDRTVSFEVASVRLRVPGAVLSQRGTDTRVDLTNCPQCQTV